MSSNSFKRSIAILAGLSLGTMHVINRIQTTSANSKIITHSREDKTYEWRYGNISYKKRGYGNPILLIHDLSIGSNKTEFAYIYNKLATNNTVYVPDILGYGDSDKPAITYTAVMYEQLISDFIKNVIGTKTDIIATGDTAPILFKVAHDNPELIGKMILVNPLGLYDQNLIPSNQTRLMKLLIDIPIIGTFTYNLSSTREAIESEFKTNYLADADTFDNTMFDNIVDSYFRAAHISGHEAKYSYASHLSKYTTCSILHELKEINNSILIIGGEKEKDIETNIENYLYYNNAIESEIIDGTAHLPHVEKPAEFTNIVEVFFS